MHATFENMYYFEADRGQTLTGSGFLVGFRLGYVHWVSDDFGLLLNAAARAGGVEHGLYTSLSGRLGVSWRL